MNCLLVPTLALDLSLLEKMANSVDYPIRNKVVLNNGKLGALRDWNSLHKDWRVFESGKNLGCAGAWNMAPVIWPEEDAWLIMNDDGEFQPGCLERICKSSDDHAKDVHVIYVNQYQAYDIFVWTSKGVDEFGLFDENFWPIYFEDWEMRARFKAVNGKYHIIEGGSFPVKHGKTIPAGPKYHKMLAGVKPYNEDYLLRKWGSVSDIPLFKTPFNNPDAKIYVWAIEEHLRAKREKIWSEFWNNNPSLYA